MSTCSRLLVPTQVLGLALVASLFAGCDSGSSGGNPGVGIGRGGAAELLKVEYGRLVDIYAYRRVDPAVGDRRNSANRAPVLVRREVVVDSSIESQPLFDSVGQVNAAASYRFLPFDSEVGHEELLILWDDRSQFQMESAEFDAALAQAMSNLVEVAASYREQDTRARPIPVVPRNAALVLTFDSDLDTDLSFFAANPAAVQLLDIRGDPKTMAPTDALFNLPFRLLPRGNKLVLDPTILGDERQGTGNIASGLPASHDSASANIRLAIPSRGSVSAAMRIEEDRIQQLNGLDSSGRRSVIRDFRSGNQRDGRVGALIDVEPPMIVGDFEMGIIKIERDRPGSPSGGVITLNKRLNLVALRGRTPFVDGAIDGNTGLPLGPGELATTIPLRSGDILTQEVVSPIGEIVRMRAEILQNFSVGTERGDPDLPNLGRARDGTEAENDTIVRVRVANLDGLDSEENVISFQANALPLGADCITRVHYYEFVPYRTGGGQISDAPRRGRFLVFDPPPPLLDENRNPLPPGSKVDPIASVAVRFNEPMNSESVDRLGNFVLTASSINGNNAAALLREDKPAALSIQDAQLLDIDGDGTLLSLSPRLGHNHRRGVAEEYWFHLLLGSDGPTDLAQNPVNVFDTRLQPSRNFSVGYSLDEDTIDNFVASRVFRFESGDEDGSPPGAQDMFGQFLLQDGSLVAAPTTRFSVTADSQNLGGILRYTRGECFSPSSGMTITPAGHPGALYQTPSTAATNAGMATVVEPHQPRGSRLQMTYREEDFGLNVSDPNLMALDIEQMYWAPYNDAPVLFDSFDRYTLALGHADKRPDLRFFFVQANDPTPEGCFLDCASLNSGLSRNFGSNVLQGTEMVTVLKDRAYQIDPNSAFRSASGLKYVPYPEFDRSYTWRDERLISWDPTTRSATGLGGAQEPMGLFPNQDTTASADSPWGLNRPPQLFDQTTYVLDQGDFWGNRTRDHSPVALPLLLDFQVFAEDGSFPVASGTNAFHMALVGPDPAGYYNQFPDGFCGLPFPLFRIHTSGGFDPNLGTDITVNPDTTLNATGAWIPGTTSPTGLPLNVPGGDGHLPWAQADLVRKVSIVTFGFFDTTLPNQHGLGDQEPPFPSDWPGIDEPEGFPNFQTVEADLGLRMRISNLVTSMDPPRADQPAGTSVQIEFRGVEVMEQAELYNPGEDNTVGGRGNLLNPNYACEAFRYAMPNAGDAGDTPRVKVEGMTPYVEQDGLDALRDRAGLLPRYMNFRIIFQNGVDITPTTSPSLKGFAVSFRMQPAT